MKRLLFFVLLSFPALIIYSQIQSVIPSQPTVGNSISFKIKTFIPLGSSFPLDCPPFIGYTDSLKQNNRLIYDLYFDLSGGWLNHGCVRYDTVDVSSHLNSGNYTMLAYWHVVMDTSFGAGQYDTTDRSASAPDTFYFIVSGATSLEEFSTQDVKLFPNPVKENLKVSISSISRIEDLKITDISGREYELPIQKQQGGVWVIGVTGLSKGVYLIQLLTETGIYVEKFVKW